MKYAVSLANATPVFSGDSDAPLVGAVLVLVAVVILLFCVGGFIWSSHDDKKRRITDAGKHTDTTS